MDSEIAEIITRLQKKIQVISVVIHALEEIDRGSTVAMSLKEAKEDIGDVVLAAPHVEPTGKSRSSKKKGHMTPEGKRRLSAALRLRHKRIKEEKEAAAKKAAGKNGKRGLREVA